MIDALLKVGGTTVLVPCLFALLVGSCAKGLFGVHQSRRATRKDFLDLWSHKDVHDELWLQTVIRHLFGEWLPVPVIRLLMTSPQSGRALVEISDAWDFLEIEDETQSLRWKAPKHAKPSCRRREFRLWMLAYWVLGLLAIGMMIHALTGSAEGTALIVHWVLAIELAVFAAACLLRGENLKAAHAAVPRWLALP